MEQRAEELFRNQIEAFVQENILIPELNLEYALRARFRYNKDYFGKTFRKAL